MNVTSTAPPGYETKSAEYFGEARPEMLTFVPSHCRRVLDVGCGTGAFGELLKKTRKVEVWGVEPVGSAAAKASSKIDHVLNGSFDSGSELPRGMFDCIVFNDVLEHMVFPEQALQYAKSLLVEGGVVVASIPNIRSLVTLFHLLFRARWEYTDSGVLDKTHLRFFTKSSIVNMFEREGYALEEICGINVQRDNVSRRLWAAYAVTNALSLGKFTDLRFLQFAVVAKPVSIR
jgi:2-polyprenyl-3-methyl-5-hydroxy-6-metoxy-1,4-benzoquinol methylase